MTVVVKVDNQSLCVLKRALKVPPRLILFMPGLDA